MTGIGRRHMSSVAPALPAAAASVADLSPSQLPFERVFFVQRAGAKGSAKLVTSATDVGDLLEEAAIKLELDAPLDSITLQLAAKNKDGKDKLVPLDSMDTIAEALTKASAVLGRAIAPTEKLRIVVDVEGAGAAAASRVVVSGPPAFPALPPAMSLTEVTLGGETWMEAEVPRKSTGTTRTAPVFFIEQQIDALRNFIREEPTETPKALMLVGTIKSGKSTLLRKVLPGLIAAEYAAAEWQPLRTLLYKGLHESVRWQPLRPRPVIFTYSFPLGADAETAAMHFCDTVDEFARQINVPFTMPTRGSALNKLPSKLVGLCESIKDSGGEVWLLLDEIQGPGLGSPPATAALFTQTFKMVGRAHGSDASCCAAAAQHSHYPAAVGSEWLFLHRARSATAICAVVTICIALPPPTLCSSWSCARHLHASWSRAAASSHCSTHSAPPTSTGSRCGML